MNELRVSIVQTNIIWENISANLNNYMALIADLQTDIIVLPEMFSTGFSMKPTQLAETMNGQSIRWMAKMAQQLDAVVAGSLMVKENGQYYNRFVWMEASGRFHTYDKRHLFRMAKEHDVYTAGNERLIVECKGWKICPLVCYDLRFPVWSRNKGQAYDCLIYIANWPAVRSYPWSQLLKARAIENLAYTIGVNRVGIDGNGHVYSGDSAVIDYAGKVLWTEKEVETVVTQVLCKDRLTQFRQQFPAWMDADDFAIL